MRELAPLLREAVRTGSFGALGRLLADDAVLDTSSERGRHQRPGERPSLAGVRVENLCRPLAGRSEGRRDGR